MLDEDTVVVDAATNRSNASRPKRVTKPSTHFEQGINRPGTSALLSTNTDDAEAALKLILELLQIQTKTNEEQARKYEVLVQEQGRKYEVLLQEQGRKYEFSLQEQARKHEAQLSGIKNQLDNLTSANRSLTTSYADAVKAGLAQSPPATTSQGTPVTGICSMNPSSSASQLNIDTSLNLAIDLTDTSSTAHRTAKPGAVRKQIDDALAGHEPTKDIQCRGH